MSKAARRAINERLRENAKAQGHGRLLPKRVRWARENTLRHAQGARRKMVGPD